MEASSLGYGEEMHLEGAHSPHVGQLRVVLHGHEQQVDAVEELHAGHGRHPHVEEDSEEHCERHLLQDGREEHGETEDGRDESGG